jgi:small subunit ribosomal protein S21
LGFRFLSIFASGARDKFLLTTQKGAAAIDAGFAVVSYVPLAQFVVVWQQFPVLYKGPVGTVWRCSYLAEVRVQEGEPLENALRRFKRKVQQEDIIKEVKRHSFYLKPGEKKRVKEALARKRNRKKARKEQD